MAHNPRQPLLLASACVDDARACKDETERELMRAASRINDTVMERAVAFMREGHDGAGSGGLHRGPVRRRGLRRGGLPAHRLLRPPRRRPHHEADQTPLRAGDCIVIDMGCRKDRYCSDMTRTFFCGQPDPQYAAIHDLVRGANELAESMIRPGVPGDLDKAARDHIAAAGYGEFFTHRLGHFIGQTDHEQGDVSGTTELIAKPGMIFSIEPGVYLPGKFGVRVEDLVLVTEDGCEILNHVDKHWKSVGWRPGANGERDVWASFRRAILFDKKQTGKERCSLPVFFFMTGFNSACPGMSTISAMASSQALETMVAPQSPPPGCSWRGQSPMAPAVSMEMSLASSPAQ